MAATTTAASANGSGAAAKAKEAGESVATAARTAKALRSRQERRWSGLVGGLALGARMGSKRRKVLGLPVGRKRPMVRAAEALGKVALRLGSAAHQATATADDVRQIREELDEANRQSPVEVLLDGLTHRRGAHKRES